jgi:hypothetical protein
MPAGAVYVGRPTMWGNPFEGGIGAASAFYYWLTGRGMIYIPTFCSECGCNGVITGAGLAVQLTQNMYDEWSQMHDAKLAILGHINKLRGADLACWCDLDQPCHADALLELANQ